MANWNVEEEEQSLLAKQLAELEAWSIETWVALETQGAPEVYEDLARITARTAATVYLRHLRDHVLACLKPLLNGAPAPNLLARGIRETKPYQPRIGNLLANEFKARDNGQAPLENRISMLNTTYLEQASQRAIDTSTNVAKIAAEDMAARTSELFERMQADARSSLTQSEHARSEAEKQLKHIHDALTEATRIAQAKQFADERRLASSDAKLWFWICVGLTAALSGYLATLVLCPAKLDSDLAKLEWYVAGNLQLFAPRATLFATLSFVLGVAVNIYRSARHNETLNAHRAATLATVKLLSEGDGKLHEDLLRMASYGMFMPTSTGFDGKVPVMPPLQEVVRRASGAE